MDKTLIMNIDNNTDLLAKEPPLGKLLFHPVPFPNHPVVIVKRKEAVSVITQYMDNYQGRDFILTPDNYGLEVSINYDEGKFVNMILKGTGEQGERVVDNIATMFMPVESKSKEKITLHALLSVQDLAEFRGELAKEEVGAFLKRCLFHGFPRYKDKQVVCRPYRMYVNGKLDETDEIWGKIGSMVLTGLDQACSHAGLGTCVADYVNNNGYMLPQRGVTVMDSEPLEENAFPQTHFLFDESNEELT